MCAGCVVVYDVCMCNVVCGCCTCGVYCVLLIVRELVCGRWNTVLVPKCTVGFVLCVALWCACVLCNLIWCCSASFCAFNESNWL